MPSPRLCLLLLPALFAGCDTLSDNRRQQEADRLAREDAARRQIRLRETSLNKAEYESLSNKMGWSRTDARGLPIPPTTEELEKRVKAAEQAR